MEKIVVWGCVAFLLFANVCECIEFRTAANAASVFEITRVAGKTPDDCIAGTGVTLGGATGLASRDCNPAQPASSSTIIVPSISTPNIALIATGRINAGTFPINIIGTDLGNIPPGAFVCLGQYNSVTDTALPCAQGCDTNFVTQAVTVGNAAQASFTLPTNNAVAGTRAWNTVQLELEVQPRRICLNDPAQAASGPTWLGVNLGVAFSCQSVADCTGRILNPNLFPQFSSLLEFQRVQILARNGACCTTNTNFDNNNLAVGVCINSNVQQCCGAIPVEPSTSKCCNPAREWVAFHESFCRCDNVNTDCPLSEPLCCNATKYPEFHVLNPLPGRCYNSSRHACCNTGHVFDPGSQQCCAINGIQSLNSPCPCDLDTDCKSGLVNINVTLFDRFACCKQTAPLPYEPVRCTAFANFPSGTGPAQAQRCTGVCIDTTFQICCNGAVCLREYEKCCNSTCCNRFTGACKEGIRPQAAHNQHNWVEFGVKYLQCSEVEALTTLRGFWVFALPIALLLMTILSLGVMLVFASKATRSYSFVEATMMAVAVLLIFFSIPYFFSPYYKYAVVIVFVALLAIAAAAVRVLSFNVIAAVALLILLLYLIDPFHGSDYWNFSYLRAYFGEPDPETGGIFHSVGKLYRNDSSVRDIQYCTEWYDYFRLDEQLLDRDRFHNPFVYTFGYCSRAWIAALLVFGGFILVLAILLFILALMGLLLRFGRMRFEPVELEVRASDAHLIPPDPFFDGFNDELLD